MRIDGGQTAAPPVNWSSIIWFILLTWIALMIFPHEAVMWGLILVVAGVILTRYREILPALSTGATK